MGKRPKSLIFVVGNSRSGTTMLGRILGIHSKVYTFGELHFFEQLVGIDEFASNHLWTKAKAQVLVEKLLTRARDGFFAKYLQGQYQSDALKILDASSSLTPRDVYRAFMKSEAQRNGSEIACEQTPRYLFVTNELLDAYPNARIINMVRDPRDVVKSQKSKWKRRFLGGGTIPLQEAIRAWCNFHPWFVSRLWLSSVKYAQSINDDRIITIRFEDLLFDAEKEVSRICEFLGITFESEMLLPPQVGSSSGLDSPEKLGVNRERAGGWRKTGIAASDRIITEWVCKGPMQKFGYNDLRNNGRLTLAALPSMVTIPLKVAVAIPFNISRFRGVVSSIKRRLSV